MRFEGWLLASDGALLVSLDTTAVPLLG